MCDRRSYLALLEKYRIDVMLEGDQFRVLFSPSEFQDTSSQIYNMDLAFNHFNQLINANLRMEEFRTSDNHELLGAAIRSQDILLEVSFPLRSAALLESSRECRIVIYISSTMPDLQDAGHNMNTAFTQIQGLINANLRMYELLPPDIYTIACDAVPIYERIHSMFEPLRGAYGAISHSHFNIGERRHEIRQNPSLQMLGNI